MSQREEKKIHLAILLDILKHLVLELQEVLKEVAEELTEVAIIEAEESTEEEEATIEEVIRNHTQQKRKIENEL